MARTYWTRYPTTVAEGDPLDAHTARMLQESIEGSFAAIGASKLNTQHEAIVRHVGGVSTDGRDRSQSVSQGCVAHAPAHD